MDVSLPTLAAYLLVGVLSAIWFWRAIRSTGHRANFALLLVSGVFGILWPVMVPGVTLYRAVVGHPAELVDSAAAPARP